MSETSNYQISIGKFSIITRISKKALRLYDQKSLLVPYRDPYNNYRFYRSEQIEIGLKIKILSWMGFGLTEIKEILKELDNYDEYQDSLELRFKSKLLGTQLEIQRLKKVEEILHGKTVYEVLKVKITEPTIKDIPATRVISKREQGPVEIVGKLFGELIQEINKPDNQRGQVSANGAPFVIYRDECLKDEHTQKDFDISNADMECAIPIVGKIQIEADFEVKILPSTKVVSVIHTGPYHEVGSAYQKIINYMKSNNLCGSDDAREIYLNNPQEVPEDKLLTEIQIPVK